MSCMHRTYLMTTYICTPSHQKQRITVSWRAADGPIERVVKLVIIVGSLEFKRIH